MKKLQFNQSQLLLCIKLIRVEIFQYLLKIGIYFRGVNGLLEKA